MNKWQKFLIFTKGKKGIITSYTNDFNKELQRWDKYIKTGEKAIFLFEEYNNEFGKIRSWGAGYRYNFYDSFEWLSIRSKVFLLFGYKCMKCGINNSEMHIDHIKPRSHNMHLQLELTNLQVLCKSCNIDKSNLNEIDYRSESQKFIAQNFSIKT